jgi:pimeloyl-ACP methyl ester carboxylesterase
MRKRLLLGVPLLALLLAIVWFAVAPLGFGGWRQPLADTPADHGMSFETIEFRPRNQELTLRAWWMPPAAPAKAALVMAHGGGSNRSELYTRWLELAARLVAHGYGVLALDLRNHGESGASASGPTFGVEEANDIVAAIDELQRRTPGVRVGGLGHSMGGQTMLYAMAREPRLEAVVSDSTFTDIGSITANFGHAATGLPTVLFTAPFRWSAQHLHGVVLDRARAIDIVGSLSPRPLLIVHDEADPIVPVEQARALHAANPSSELWITSTPADQLRPELRTRFGTHCASYQTYPDAYTERVTAFFDRIFARAGPVQRTTINDQ